MRMIAMKPYLTPILIILVLISGTLVSCGQNESTAKLIAYFDEAQPIVKRHSVTLVAINKAIEAIESEGKKPAAPKDKPSASSKTQMEVIETPKPELGVPVSVHSLTRDAIQRALTTPPSTPKPTIPSGLKEALTSGVDALDSGLSRMDSEIHDYKLLNPPPEASTYHGLTIEVLLKDQAIFNDIHSNYKSLLSYGYSDKEAQNRAKKQFVERERLWLLATSELQGLLKKAGR